MSEIIAVPSVDIALAILPGEWHRQWSIDIGIGKESLDENKSPEMTIYPGPDVAYFIHDNKKVYYLSTKAYDELNFAEKALLQVILFGGKVMNTLAEGIVGKNKDENKFNWHEFGAGAVFIILSKPIPTPWDAISFFGGTALSGHAIYKYGSKKGWSLTKMLIKEDEKSAEAK